ncbi:MAG TPA: L17 family ribosomal protein [Candidatus Dojkabacteria bacterium]|nr:L17 family ribosomal protein [Candidatus Dojkabacteria bacterium]
MLKRNGYTKLGRKTSHRVSLVRNLVRSIFSSGSITTTTSKAKVLRGEVLSLLASVKRMEPQSALRLVKTYFADRKHVDMVLNYAKVENNGVQMVKVGFRPGDNSEKSKISLIGYEVEKKGKKLGAKSEDKKVKKETKVKAEPKIKAKASQNTGKVKAVTVKKERSRTRSGI